MKVRAVADIRRAALLGLSTDQAVRVYVCPDADERYLWLQGENPDTYCGTCGKGYVTSCPKCDYYFHPSDVDADFHAHCGGPIPWAEARGKASDREAQPRVFLTREGAFLPGQQFDAMQLVAGIVSEARTSIFLVDNYLGGDVLKLLAGKRPDVAVRILTAHLPQPLEALASAFIKQHGGLEIRISTAIHDRFLMVDEGEIFHFGASFKDAGQRGFMFSRVEEPTVVETIRRLIHQEWEKGQVRTA